MAVVDTRRLTAEDAMGLLELRELTAAELHAAYLDAIRERDGELHAYLRTVDEPGGDGIPIAVKDVISTRGIETIQRRRRGSARPVSVGLGQVSSSATTATF